jgi:PTH1 family peptidyl-tRNA hydrolase
MSIISKSPFNFKLGWGDTRSKPEVSMNISKDEGGFTKLIVGLGNVGDKYVGTRHNIGFEIIEEYAQQNNFPSFKENKKFFGSCSDKFVEGKKIILLKPSTLMNLSGKSVRAVAEFYNIPAKDITLIHDELDLDFGTIKLKYGGEGKSSHNGLKDISKQLGTNEYQRIRFGIKNHLLEKMDAKDFVLGKFNKEEQNKIKDLIKDVLSLI